MASDRPVEEDVRSPCVNICEMDAKREFCRGCLRTIDEIFNWPIATRNEKLAVLERVAERRAHAPGLEHKIASPAQGKG